MSNDINKTNDDDNFTTAPRNRQSTSPVKTAGGEFYDAATVYFYFESQTARVRESAGLRQVGEHLCRYGSKVVAVRHLYANRDGAIEAAQKHFKGEIAALEKQITELEKQKTGERRRLKNFALIGD